MSDDRSRIPPYTDTIAIPFRIPPGLIGSRLKRTVAARPDRAPAEQQPADAAPSGQPVGRASPVQAARGASPAAASGEWPHPAVALVVAQVRGHDDLVVSGFSDGPLTLYRRGNDQPPRPLASFAADLDGSFWSGDGKFLGRMVANEVALFHPDWLRGIGAGEVQLAGDPPDEGAEPENPAQRELEKEFRHLESSRFSRSGARVRHCRSRASSVPPRWSSRLFRSCLPPAPRGNPGRQPLRVLCRSASPIRTASRVLVGSFTRG